MTAPIDPVSDTELDAYVDGELDLARRIAVEDYLARNPAAAARVMADLCIRDELRLALPPPARPARAGIADAARRLERGLAFGRIVTVARRLAAVAALVAIGWFAHDEVSPLAVTASVASSTPAFVDDAVMSHRTALVRSGLHAHAPAHDYDIGRIRAQTGIVMPQLPQGWQVLDLQVLSSKFGPSIETAVAADDLGTVSLFAVRPGSFGVTMPAVTVKDREAVAYWQVGETAYALTGAADGRAIGRVADRLAQSLY
jgi:anti-sigma factor RsiW